MRFPSRSESFDRIREKVISGQAALEFGDSAQALTLLDEAVGQVLALDWSDETVWKRWPVMQGVLQFAKQYLAQEIAESSLAPDVSDNSDEPRFLTSIPELMIVNREMRAIIDQIVRIRHTRMNVLITGESGVGKELLAKAIHVESDLRDNVYIPFNCAAVAPELLESRLFGHRRGAFTGAVTDQRGVIRAAEGGTLFLDEVGELPLEVQPKLLRFLQEGEIQPLGEDRPLKVKVRIVAATNRHLEAQVAEGNFREDLFHRLNVIRIDVPPLRERREEILPLAQRFLKELAGRAKKDLQLSEGAAFMLQNFNWPGNIRQLRNEMERMVAYAEDKQLITPRMLSPEITSFKPVTSATVGSSRSDGSIRVEFPPGLELAQILDAVEKQIVTETLARNKNNISKTARELGITRKGLHIKRDRLGI